VSSAKNISSLSSGRCIFIWKVIFLSYWLEKICNYLVLTPGFTYWTHSFCWHITNGLVKCLSVSVFVLSWGILGTVFH
jgi:hypothetical protein